MVLHQRYQQLFIVFQSFLHVFFFFKLIVIKQLQQFSRSLTACHSFQLLSYVVFSLVFSFDCISKAILVIESFCLAEAKKNSLNSHAMKGFAACAVTALPLTFCLALFTCCFYTSMLRKNVSSFFLPLLKKASIAILLHFQYEVFYNTQIQGLSPLQSHNYHFSVYLNSSICTF